MTIKPMSECPNPLDGIHNPDEAMKLKAGYRYAPELPEPANGYERLSPPILIEGDGMYGEWELRDTLIQTRLDEAAAARQADFIAKGLVPVAVLFRILLRRNFGPLSETDRSVDEKMVEGYFATLTINQTITAQQASDGVFLKESFTKLAAWNGTGETWTIFEKYGGIIP